MHTSIRRVVFVAFVFLSLSFSGLRAQTAGSAGTLSGVVSDQTGAVLPGAVVTVVNPVSGNTVQAVLGEVALWVDEHEASARNHVRRQHRQRWARLQLQLLLSCRTCLLPALRCCFSIMVMCSV